MFLFEKPRVELLYDHNNIVIPLKKGQENWLVEHISSLSLDLDKELEVDIKNIKQKRSLDANAYMWVLCDKIAKKLGSTKEEVYKNAIKDVGVCQYVKVSSEAMDSFIEMYGKSSLGAFAEFCYSMPKNPDEVCVVTYFGSSSYDTNEMSRLIDYIVGEAREQGIDVRTPDEIEKMKRMWGV